ncbi:MAG: hypothetical protein CMQ34_06865 [Gammaproteobacteria bacterium]|nr:hypothetical protein [Gammaproteobacteria bacterium]
MLWTLLVIEAGELIGFIANFDLSALLANGIIAMFVNLIVAQFGNIITAVMWFGYWPGSGGASVVIWVGIAYAGYLLGIHLARESDSLHSVSDLVRRIRAMRNRPKENDPEK